MAVYNLAQNKITGSYDNSIVLIKLELLEEKLTTTVIRSFKENLIAFRFFL